jgi:hypothetical protein
MTHVIMKKIWHNFFSKYWSLNKTWTLPINASSALNIIKNEINLRKLWPLKVGGLRTQKNKPPNATNTGSQTPTKNFVCCSNAIKVQRWFVELKVVLP